jgi:hypothetical protein
LFDSDNFIKTACLPDATKEWLKQNKKANTLEKSHQVLEGEESFFFEIFKNNYAN